MKILGNSIVFTILFMISLFYTAFLLAMDKDINGFENAVAQRFMLEYILFGLIFMIPLTLLYATLIRFGVKIFLSVLLVTVVSLAAVSFLSPGSVVTHNYLLYFIYRVVFLVTALGVSISIAWAAGKFVFLFSDRIKSLHR